MTSSIKTVAQLSARGRTLLFALVVTAGILNLVDRQIIAVLKPTIAADLGWEARTPFADGLEAQWRWAADRVAAR